MSVAEIRMHPGRRKAVPAGIAIGIALAVACVLLYVLLPTEDRNTALSAVVEGVMLGGVYALLALGVVVVYKSSKVFNLSFGGLTMFLMYTMWYFLASRGLPLWLSLGLLALCSVLIGLIINRFLMTPLIGESGLTSFIVTMVLGFSVVYGIVLLLFGGSPAPPLDIFPEGNLTLGAISFRYAYLYSFVVATTLFLVFAAYFRFTRTGLAMRAVSENHLISLSLGVNVKRIFAMSWVVGTVSAAICGVLMGTLFAVDGGIGGLALAKGFPVLLLGGLESLPGAFIAAFIIGITETVAGTYIDPYVPGFRDVLPYVLMVAILMLRPNGLFGLREIRRM